MTERPYPSISHLKASVSAVPYATIVINAETGEVLHEENANTRLHQAGRHRTVWENYKNELFDAA